MKKKILCIIGTRPEAIKMAPVILALKAEEWADVKVLATAQHRGLLDQVNDFFGIKPDIDLDIMMPNQTLTVLTGRLLLEIDKYLDMIQPDCVLVQGDTTTVMAVSLACFYKRIPIGHIEAGLRTWDIQNPFPEEANRVITTKFTKWHFAPTEGAKHNLMRDGVAQEDIIVTGNTVIDALIMTSQKANSLPSGIGSSRKFILITSHRRENFGEPLKNICRAIQFLALNYQDFDFLFPVHPNPNVRSVVNEFLTGLKNVYLCEPLEYAPFVSAMKSAYFILTDSGGVQEEAPALSVPVLVMRDETERPEAVEAGVVRLVGSNYERIIFEAQKLIRDESEHRMMSKGISPYGDGNASSRIVGVLRKHFIKCS